MNGEKIEQPLAFFNEGLKNYEDNYSFVEKQVLVVVRALKKFRHLLSHNKVHLLVPHASVKDFLSNKDINEKRVGWITKIMEYDVEIKITKLVRGKGFYEELLSSFDIEKEVTRLIENEQPTEDGNQNNWIQDISISLIGGGYPNGLDRTKRRKFKLQSIPYALVDEKVP